MKKLISSKKSFISLLIAMVLCFAMGLFTATTAFAEVTPKTIDQVTFAMASDAKVRTSPDNATNGLRFTASMSEEDYNALLANGYESLTFGIVIAPADYLTDGKDFTEENLFGADAIYGWAEYDAESGEWAQYEGDKTEIINIYKDALKVEDGVAYLDASITNLHYNNIARDFVARGYIMANGNDYAMADYAETKEFSMALVAEKTIAEAVENGFEDDLDIEWLTDNYLENSKFYTDLTSNTVQLNNYAVGGNVANIAGLGTVQYVTDGNGNAFDFVQNGTEITIDLSGLTADKEFEATLYTFNGTYYKLYKVTVNYDQKTLITNATEFNAMRSATAGDFILMNDLTLTEALSAPTATFNATFDGNGKTIKGVVINGAYGLFSTVGGNGVVKNLLVENATLGGVQTGVIATFLSAGATLDNIYISASIKSGNHCGGIVKQVYGGEAQTKVTNCVVNITDTTWVSSNGLLFGFGSASANVDLTNTYGISTVSSATLVGNRGDSYATFRDTVNALNTAENKMVYNSVVDFNTAIYGGKVSLGNKILGFKTVGIIPISTVEELLAMRLTSGSGKIYALVNDIDLNGTNIDADPAVHWSGTFDGHGFAIKNFKLTYSSSAVGGTGFFRSITGTVKNVAFVSVSFGYGQGGVVCCQLKAGGTIDNVYVKVNLAGTSAAGGIAKTCETSSKVNITNCVVYATNTTVPSNGGLIISFAGSAAASDDIFNCAGTYGIKANEGMKLAGRESSYATFYAWLNGKDTVSTPRSFSLSDFNSAVGNKTISVDSALLSKII